MASIPSSSSCPHGSEKDDWEKCSVSHDQLSKHQTQGFLPPADLVPVQAGLTTFTSEALAENFPNPTRGGVGVLHILLNKRRGFPIHPFLQGLLEYYGLQLHNLTPASIMHITGFVALLSYSWAARPTLIYGGNFSASSLVPKRDPYSRWAVPKYGV